MELQTTILLNEDELDFLETWRRRYMSQHDLYLGPDVTIHAILRYVMRLQEQQNS